MRPAQVLLACFRKLPMQNLALPHKVGHHGRHRLRLDPRVGAVLVIKVYVVGLQPPQRAFDRTAYHLRARVRDDGVRAWSFRILKRNAEFGCQDYPVSEWFQGFPQQFLVVMGMGDGAV